MLVIRQASQKFGRWKKEKSRLQTMTWEEKKVTNKKKKEKFKPPLAFFRRLLKQLLRKLLKVRYDSHKRKKKPIHHHRHEQRYQIQGQRRAYTQRPGRESEHCKIANKKEVMTVQKAQRSSWSIQKPNEKNSSLNSPGLAFFLTSLMRFLARCSSFWSSGIRLFSLAIRSVLNLQTSTKNHLAKLVLVYKQQ